MRIDDLLMTMVQQGASDGFLTVNAPPTIKVEGRFKPLDYPPLGEDELTRLIQSTMTSKQRDQYLSERECNYAIDHAELGRFRANAYVQRGVPGMVVRYIKSDVPHFSDLGLPPVIEQLSMIQRGLVLFVGATGTGKSTSLASMIDHRNRNSSGHIVTVEDPIEYIHSHQGCLVTQREVGLDTESYEVALKNALRQAPDVVMVGEIRTQETMLAALQFAETGHLCLATLHASNANQAFDRIISFFEPKQHSQVLLDLALNLKAIIAQQLVPKLAADSRIPIVEVLLASPLIQDLIRKGELLEIKEIMERSAELGMQTFDQALFEAYKQRLISEEDALRFSDASNNVRLLIKQYKRGGRDERHDQQFSLG
jgi:twitching motility protein PilU